MPTHPGDRVCIEGDNQKHADYLAGALAKVDPARVHDLELLLSTYGERLGLKGKVCNHLNVNPHPTLIPAIESGWIQSIHSAGSELGMEPFVSARPDVFFNATGNVNTHRGVIFTLGLYCAAAGELSHRHKKLHAEAICQKVRRRVGGGSTINALTMDANQSVRAAHHADDAGGY